MGLGQLANDTETEILEKVANVDIELEDLTILLFQTLEDFKGNVELKNQELDHYETEKRDDMKNLADELSIEGVDISICVLTVEHNISVFVSTAGKQHC